MSQIPRGAHHPWLLAAILLGAAPSEAIAQAQPEALIPAPIVVGTSAWSARSPTGLPREFGPAFQSPANRSAARIIATHTVVGAAAGLLVGLVLSGASASDDEVSVALTWTALGAAAGAVSGVVTWLLGGRE